MSTGPGGPHHREEIAHDVEDLREDLAYERAALDASVKHDYSTSDTGIVPLDRRRPMWHFMGLWTTFVAGFSYMFLGFELHDAGHSLAATAGITAFGYALYICYAMVGSYLGSRTGQTHALLTRSIFGLIGSWIVSANFQPRWLQVAPGVDLSAPMFVSYGLKGNANAATMSEGQVLYQLGLQLDVKQKYVVKLAYTGGHAHQVTDSAGKLVGGSGTWWQNDRGWLNLSLKTSF
jgi:hypothetical protein